MSENKKKIFTIKQINAAKKEIFALSQPIEKGSFILDRESDEINGNVIMELASVKGQAVQLIQMKDKTFCVFIPAQFKKMFFFDKKNAQRCLSQAITNSHTRFFMSFLEDKEEIKE